MSNGIVRSLSGRGHYWLCDYVKHFAVSVEQWSKMRPEQHQKIAQRFTRLKVVLLDQCVLCPVLPLLVKVQQVVINFHAQ